jgi:hypothetical protein
MSFGGAVKYVVVIFGLLFVLLLDEYRGDVELSGCGIFTMFSINQIANTF